MNFFEAISALEQRKPVRMKEHPEMVFRVVDTKRTIDGIERIEWEIKTFFKIGFRSKSVPLERLSEEHQSHFPHEAIKAEWELADPL